LYQIMPHYLNHIEKNPDTLLTKFFGSYAIKMAHTRPLYIVILKNVFLHSPKVHQIYDLKGSWINRGGKPLAPGEVGKDLDLHSKIKVGRAFKQGLLRILAKDSTLLRDLNIMDYSLLVGIHNISKETSIPLEDESEVVIQDSNQVMEDIAADGDSGGQPDSLEFIPFGDDKEIAQRKASRRPSMGLAKQGQSNHRDLSYIQSSDKECLYFLGVIDILQEWNLNKKSERYLKIIGKCKDGDGLSAIEPDLYAERFIRNIGSYLE